MAVPPLTLDWRATALSDWRCTLGDRTFHLHKAVLSEGSRRSRFFVAAFNEHFEAQQTDLAVLLPAPCHAFVENVLDFIYGHDLPSLSPANILQIHTIADILMIDALLPFTTAELPKVVAEDPSTLKFWSLALELGLPEAIETALLQRMEPLEMMQAVAMCRPGQEQGVLQKAIALVKERDHGDLAFPFVFGRVFKKARHHVSLQCTPELKFGMCMWKRISPHTRTTRIRITRMACGCYGKAVGIADLGAVWQFPDDLAFRCHAASEAAGFVGLRSCWGYSFDAGAFFSEGRLQGKGQFQMRAFLNKVLRLECDVAEGLLRLFLEGAAENDALGEVRGNFAECESLCFAMSTCCSGTDFEVLDPQAA